MFLTFTVYPKKYAHGFCSAVLCCGYTLTDFPISIRLTSLALWQSNDCPSASKATLMNIDKYFMWIHYERLHNHNKAKHNKTVCIFLGIYCNKRLGILSTRQGNVSAMWWHRPPIWLTWKLKTKMNNQILKWDPVCNKETAINYAQHDVSQGHRNEMMITLHLCYIGYLPETHHKLIFRKALLTYIAMVQTRFAQSTAVLYALFQMIALSKQML